MSGKSNTSTKETEPEIPSGQVITLPQDSIQTITRELASMLGVDRVTVWGFTRQRDEMQLIHVHDQQVEVSLTTLVLKTHPSSKFLGAILAGRAFTSNDVKSDPFLSDLLMDYWVPWDVCSAMLIPLAWGGDIRSVVILERTGTRRRWKEGDLQRACETAARLVPHLETAERWRSHDMLAVLQEIRPTKIPDELEHGVLQHGVLRYGVLRLVIEQGCRLIHANGGLAFLREPDLDGVRCVFSYQTQCDITGQLQMDCNHPAAIVTLNGKPLILNDFTDIADDDLLGVENITSLLCTPLIWQDTPIGAVLFFRQGEQRGDGQHFFNRHDLEYIEPLIAQASLAVQMTNLQEENTRHEARQLALRGIGQVSEAASSLRDLITTSLEILCPSLKMELGVLSINGQVSTVGIPPRMGQVLAEIIRESNPEISTTLNIPDWGSPPAGTLQLAREVIRFGLVSSLMIPIRPESHEGGLLILGTNHKRCLQKDEIATAEIAASLISASAERIFASLSLQDDQYLLRMLETTGNNLNHVRGYANTLAEVGESIMALSKTYRAALLIHRRDGSVSIPWSNGLTSSCTEALISLPASALTRLFGILTRVVITPESVSAREVNLRSLLQYQDAHTICIWPMLYDENNVGTVICYYDSSPEFTALESEVIQIFLRQAAAALFNAELVEKIENQYIETALTLAKVVEDIDSGSAEISSDFAELTRQTAQEMGLSETDLEAIYYAALLHDIGKASVPRSVLQKSEPLDTQEWDILHQVPVEGEKFLGGIEQFKRAARLVRHCRERYDGNGYPDRLRGEKIPLGARILAVADAYQAMQIRRPFREPLSAEAALDELRQQAGKQFDPRVVYTFLKTAQAKGNGGHIN